MKKFDLEKEIERAKRSGGSVEVSYPCGHTINDWIDPPFESKLVDCAQAEKHGIHQSWALTFKLKGGRSARVAVVDNHSLCPECWKKAQAIPETRHRKAFEKFVEMLPGELKPLFSNALRAIKGEQQ